MGLVTPDLEAPAKQSGDGFSGREVADLIGATYRQVDYWARLGLFRPSLADARGSGSRRRYSEADVELGMALTQLFALRVETDQIHAAVRAVGRRRVEPAGEWLVIPMRAEPIRIRAATLPESLPAPSRLIRLRSYVVPELAGGAT